MDEPIYGTYKGSEIMIPVDSLSWDEKRKCVKMVPQVLEPNSNVPPEIFLSDRELIFPENKKREIAEKLAQQLGSHLPHDCWRLRPED